MANKQTTITITHGNEAYGTIKGKFLKGSSLPREEAVRISTFFDAVTLGNRACKFAVSTNTGDAVAASGTFTFSAHSAASDTVVINGTTFTAESSGASGNQWNIGTTATQCATNLAAAINGSATAIVSGAVIATSSAGVVTVTALVTGQAGNMFTIAKGTDSGSVCTVSGAKLTGGAAATTVDGPNTYHAGV